MTYVKFLGGCQKVGASAVLVEHAGTRVLLDYGVAFNGDRRVPLPTSTRNLTAVLSHAHLDHSGSLPLIAGSHTNNVPIYSTALTRAMLRLLLGDMLRINGDHLAFEKREVQQLLKNTQTLTYGQTQQVNPKIKITLRDAGHIPGSASILVETERNGSGPARILYTGDLNTTDTQLTKGAGNIRELGELDLVIVESTYALHDHPPRKEVEQRFTEAVKSTLETNGTALVPSFAVGRAQEVLSVLYKNRNLGLDYPIYIDGMARSVTKVMLQHLKGFTGGTQLQQAVKYATFVRKEKDRRQALEEPSIIIAPAGMLKGGSAQRYLRAIAQDSRSQILLVGKQLPGTPGAELLETGNLPVHSRDGTSRQIRVKAKVDSFDFSCHVGRSQVLEFLRNVKGDPTILTMHGDPKSCQSLASTLHTMHGFNATSPFEGQVLKLN
ncbi:MAG: MBL fold metallo-hydrolase [Promethearchaeota archaeon]